MMFLGNSKFIITVESEQDLTVAMKCYHDLFSSDPENLFVTEIDLKNNVVYVNSINKKAKPESAEKYPIDVMAKMTWVHLQALKTPEKDCDVRIAYELNASWNKGISITPISCYVGK